MPTSDAPALNPDGTLKDVGEIEWLNSPSDENHTVSLKDPKKRERTNSEHDTDVNLLGFWLLVVLISV